MRHSQDIPSGITNRIALLQAFCPCITAYSSCRAIYCMACLQFRHVIRSTNKEQIQVSNEYRRVNGPPAPLWPTNPDSLGRQTLLLFEYFNTPFLRLGYR